jgi:hypothetical protein
VASILPFLRPNDGVFDDAATRAMGEAFDAARKEVGSAERAVHEAIAARIISAAERGERDPMRLLNIALAGLGHDRTG